MRYKTPKYCQNCERFASLVPMPPTKSTKRVNNVQDVILAYLLLLLLLYFIFLYMSHNHVQHKQSFVSPNTNIADDTKDHTRQSFAAGYTLLPPLLVLTTLPNLKGYLG